MEVAGSEQPGPREEEDEAHTESVCCINDCEDSEGPYQEEGGTSADEADSGDGTSDGRGKEDVVEGASASLGCGDDGGDASGAAGLRCAHGESEEDAGADGDGTGSEVGGAVGEGDEIEKSSHAAAAEDEVPAEVAAEGGVAGEMEPLDTAPAQRLEDEPGNAEGGDVLARHEHDDEDAREQEEESDPRDAADGASGNGECVEASQGSAAASDESGASGDVWGGFSVVHGGGDGSMEWNDEEGEGGFTSVAVDDDSFGGEWGTGESATSFSFEAAEGEEAEGGGRTFDAFGHERPLPEQSPIDLELISLLFCTEIRREEDGDREAVESTGVEGKGATREGVEGCGLRVKGAARCGVGARERTGAIELPKDHFTDSDEVMVLGKPVPLLEVLPVRVYTCIWCAKLLQHRRKWTQWVESSANRKKLAEALGVNEERLAGQVHAETPGGVEPAFVDLLEPLPSASRTEQLDVCYFGEEDKSSHPVDATFFASCPVEGSERYRYAREMRRIGRRQRRTAARDGGEDHTAISSPAARAAGGRGAHPTSSQAKKPVLSALEKIGAARPLRDGITKASVELAKATGVPMLPSAAASRELMSHTTPVSEESFLLRSHQVSAIDEGFIASSSSGVDGLAALDDHMADEVMGLRELKASPSGVNTSSSPPKSSASSYFSPTWFRSRSSAGTALPSPPD